MKTKYDGKSLKLSELGVLSLAEGVDGKFKVPKQIQLMRTGQFFRLYGDGEVAYEVKLTEDMLDNMLKNHAENVVGLDLAIDFAHENYYKAAGWIKELRKIESVDFPGEFELMCTPRWSKSGLEAVEGGEYRYLSVEIHTNYRDNQSLDYFGPTLLGAGLTNRPFIKEMQPTSKLSDQTKEIEDMKELEKLQADLETKNTEVVTLSEEIRTLKETNETLTTEKETLSEEVKTLKEEKVVSEKKTKFDAMLSEGKVCEAQREAFMSDDLEKFASLTETVKLTEDGTSEIPKDKTEEEKEKETLSQATAYIEEQKQLGITTSMGDAISHILANQ